jgi:DNA polymerase elongation subunit (family B)
LVFLLLDIETCPCHEPPSTEDHVLGIGLRECNMGDCKTDYIYTWDDDPSCNNVYECERSTLEKLLMRIGEYRSDVYVIGYNIKTFDLPILSYRLYKTNIVGNISDALDLMLGVYKKGEKRERRIIYLDVMDIVKALVFPKVRCLKAYRIAEASSRCLGEDVKLSEDAEYLKFLREKCRGKLCEDEVILDAETKRELGSKVRERLGEDLRRLTMMYRLLLAPGKEGREKDIQCLATALGRIVDECQKGKE